MVCLLWCIDFYFSQSVFVFLLQTEALSNESIITEDDRGVLWHNQTVLLHCVSPNNYSLISSIANEPKNQNH